MPDIFIVGKEQLKIEYKRDLIAKGYKVKGFESPRTVLRKLNENADLLILDRQQDSEPSFKELLKLSKHIPKIIISDSDSSGRPMPWLREPLTYPLHAPSKKSLDVL
ncbi:MAG: response regulator transcription factor [Nitrospira sp.]|nr:response regulator transcription factor [Nitrospira sp.]